VKTFFFVLLTLVVMLVITRKMGVATDIATVDGAVASFMKSFGL
jgi:hypothetical protein